jgi:hypothetical protein
VTDHTKQQIVRTVIKACWKPFAEIRNQVELKISDTTVRNVLADEGYYQWVAHKVPYLKREHKKDWRRWACEFKGFSENDWEKVIWSNECYMHLGDNHGPIYITHHPEGCLVPTFKQSTVCIMVWGSIIRGKRAIDCARVSWKERWQDELEVLSRSSA